MEQMLTLRTEFRVWQDERFGCIWRLAYRDGADETVVSFPDIEALGDFLNEQFGLDLLETHENMVLAA
ncbi:hypothetical protein [Candidatus Chloroploca sp. Khr17]|uniref:hypothetical protein n=1 Tax=Candidatus Chloroploca sp. Khr17 TaxID=2496869 RepID=UPI00101DB279|nr:hypothetical protein [Candidatus Chloroploca sp. Khr17]